MLRSLGGLELEASAFRRPKPLLLLTYLTLEGAQSRRHLTELFWPNNPQANRNLTTTLGRLRQAVPGAIEADDVRVEGSVHTDVDALRERLAAGDLDGAMSLYRGSFLDGLDLPHWSVELEEWVYQQREAVAEELRAAILNRAKLEAGRGHLDAGAAWAATAVTLPGAAAPEPQLLHQLHTLLRAADHPLAVTVAKEAEEYGLAVASTGAEARAALDALRFATTPHNLPARGGAFVGRDAELADMRRALADADLRLLTLVGPGGTGKTRLALQAARESLAAGFAGVYFVGLEAAMDVGAATAAMAEVLGNDAPGGAGDPLDRVARSIGTQRYLMVLDNLEQVAHGPRLVAALLERCENLKLVVTTRERLELGAEWVVQVEGLGYPPAAGESTAAALHQYDAVKLFVLRAQQVTPELELEGEDLLHVARLCRLLRGAPLGIELGAAMTRVLSCSQLADEAERTFDVLRRNSAAENDRHQSLRSAFTHSWRLLDSDQRSMLGTLTVFRGGFDHAAAVAVSEGTITTLVALVDKSLVYRSGDERLALHPVTRQYAYEKVMDDAEAVGAAQRRHARWYLTMAESAEVHLKGADQVKWLARLSLERDNLRAALDWDLAEGEAELGLRTAAALQQFWWLRGPYQEGRDYLTAFCALPGALAQPLLRGKALHRAGTLCQEAGDHLEAGELYQAAQALAEEHADQQLLADSLHSRGLLASKQGQHGESRGFYQRCLALQRHIGDRWGHSVTLNNMAMNEVYAGGYSQARTLLRKSLALKEELADTQGIAYALNNLGTVCLQLGELEEADAYVRRSLDLKRRLEDSGGVASSLANLGRIATRQGRYREAAEYLSDSVLSVEPLENRWTLAWVVAAIVELEAKAGRPERALTLAGAVEALCASFEIAVPTGSVAELAVGTRLSIQALGEEPAEELLRHGRSLSVSELVALAGAYP
ncbi:MAG TPA: tetratricopeptide repeat protein [Trueperaceae bacterium]|nr:tetratricopeptide repeat protein [Trueperaceae bacterium]